MVNLLKKLRCWWRHQVDSCCIQDWIDWEDGKGPYWSGTCSVCGRQYETNHYRYWLME